MHLLGTWAKPSDNLAWALLAIAVVLLLLAALPSGPSFLGSMLDFAAVDDLSRRRRFLTLGSFAAAFLSLGYVAHYLHGGPRALEATTYFFQGRALAHADLAWSVPEPSASFRGALRIYRDATGELAGPLPPGLPLLLAPGFLFGAPMVIGPLIAAGICLATYLLARELFLREAVARGRGTEDPLGAEAVGRVAIGVSIICAALRYQTAETTANGASGLAITLALACALRARRLFDERARTHPGARASTSERGGSLLLAGLAVGFAFAVRPLSALPVAAVVLALAAGTPRGAKGRAFFTLVLGALPGILFLVAANRAATGSSAHAGIVDYFAVAGPRHALDFHGVADAARAALGRVRAHALDVANLEPLGLLVFAPLFVRSKENRAPLAVLVVVVGQLLVWAPVNAGQDAVVGLGSRVLSDVLPLEHALIAFALAKLLPRIGIARKALVYFALAAAGFAVHASFAHDALAASGPGRPAYSTDAVREAGATSGLLFMDTDEGFDLAASPDIMPSHALVAVRARGDDNDRLVYDLFGHPPVHRYDDSGEHPAVVFWAPPAPQAAPGEETWRFEAESEWPPLVRHGDAWSEPLTLSGTCASNGHALGVQNEGGALGVQNEGGALGVHNEGGALGVQNEGARGKGQGDVVIDLPVPRDGKWRVLPRIFRRGTAGEGTLRLFDHTSPVPLAEWTWSDARPVPFASECTDLPAKDIVLVAAKRAYLVLEVRSGEKPEAKAVAGPSEVALDRTNLVWTGANPK